MTLMATHVSNVVRQSPHQKFFAMQNDQRLISIDRGSVIPMIKNKIWFVVQGLVKFRSKTIYEDSLILGYAGPNELFGEPLINMEVFQTIAMTNCQFHCIDIDEIYKSKSLLIEMNKSLSLRYRQSESMLSITGIKKSLLKIFGFLEMIALDYGKPVEKGLSIPFTLTHEEISDVLGMTRVTVTRTLSSLRDKGLIAKDTNRNFVILNSLSSDLIN